MGIIIFLGYNIEGIMNFWFAYIILHLVGIIYFWKFHKLIFTKKRQSGGFAGVISFIGIGFGQHIIYK